MNPFLFRRIRGPVFLLCFALTALLAEYHILSFARSWPIYLLAAGLMRVLEALLPATVYPGTLGPRRSPFALGVIEIIIGLVAVLLATNELSFDNFWRVYSIWWPLLLIVLGLLLIVERIFEGSRSRRFPGYAGGYGMRRRRHGGLVSLVILLLILGVISHHARYGDRNDWDSNGNGDWSWPSGWNWNESGATQTNDIKLAQPFHNAGTLSVDNARGDVQVTPSTDGLIHLSAHQTTHDSASRKESAFRDTRPVFEIHGATASITVPGRNGTQVDLVLSVPPSVACNLSSHHGDISVSGMTGALAVNQDHGGVSIDSAGGPVRLTMDHGDVRANAVAGDLSIDGRADDISLSGVTGSVQLHGDFFGDTEITGAGGAVDFASNRTQITIAHLAGQLSLDSGDLRLGQSSGGVTIRTRSKDIEVASASGPVTIDDSNGDVTLSTAAPLGDVTVTNDTGDITFSAPPGAAFHVIGATSSDDEIDSAFPLTQSTTDSRKTITGQVGDDGPRINLQTVHGDLTLHRGTDELPERPAAPEAPQKPEKPAHMRHLQSSSEPPSPTVQ
jgi:DUF4097 and DUF4098 domain-containing protein YvlB